MENHDNLPGFMDRELHREILFELQNSFPHKLNYMHLRFEKDQQDKLKALEYLAGHGLVSVSFPKKRWSGNTEPWHASITAKGLDFIADDGGLSAILNVITVKFDENTIRELMLAKIESAAVTPEERSSLKQAIRNLPTKSFQKLIDTMIEKGADYLVSEIPRLGTLLNQIAIQLP